MNTPNQLPQVALDHMSDVAKQHIPASLLPTWPDGAVHTLDINMATYANQTPPVMVDFDGTVNGGTPVGQGFVYTTDLAMGGVNDISGLLHVADIFVSSNGTTETFTANSNEAGFAMVNAPFAQAANINPRAEPITYSNTLTVNAADLTDHTLIVLTTQGHFVAIGDATQVVGTSGLPHYTFHYADYV